MDLEFIDIIEAGKFWDAPDSDIFALPLVAIALGIGRNKMHILPVTKIMIDRRACYKKGDILDWALSDAGKSMLTVLRSENTKIGRVVTARTKAYDLYYTGDPESHYRPSNGIKETKQDKHERLWREWTEIWRRRDTYCDDEALKMLIKLAWDYRKQFVKMRMGLPKGLYINNWWFAENFPEAKRGRVRENIKWLQDELEYLETYGRPRQLFFIDPEFKINEEIKEVKQVLVQLNAELNEIS